MYITVQLPTEFVKESIDPLVKDKRLGYASRASVVIDAVKVLNTQLKENAKETDEARISDSKPVEV